MPKAKNKDFPLFIGFLLLSSIAGVCLIYLAARRWGPGLSTDAVLNLSAAANLLQGRRFLDLYGNPMTQWPPLYAAIIAVLSKVTGMDIFQVGWHLNALTFGLIIFSSGILFHETYPDRPLFAYAGTLIVLTSLGLIQIASNIASDPLFLLLVVLFLLSALRFAKTRKPAYVFLMGLLACLAPFQKYAGLVLALTGSGYLLYYYRARLTQALLGSSLFLVFSGLPIIGWGLFHNRPITGTLFGTNKVTNPLGDLYLLIEKLLYWFFPYSLIRIATPIGLLAAILIVIILINRRPHWKNWLNRLTADAQMANTIFSAIYGATLIFLVSYAEQRNLESQRYYVVILPSLLIILFAAIQELIPPRPGSPQEALKYRIMTVLFVLWLVYPISKIQGYIQKSSEDEASGNNIYNTAAIRESDFLKTVYTLADTDQKLYSNYEAAAWFYLRKDILGLPRVDKKGQLDETALAEFRESVGPNGGGYIIWFRTIHIRDNLPEPGQLYQMAKIEPVFISSVGDVYHIISNQP